jgi:flagellar hook-associated protein 2
MASLTASGLGSGLDVASIISQLMTIERQPLRTLQKEESSTNAKISSFGKIQSAVSTLRTKVAAFNSSSLWGNTAATLTDASVATATSISGQKGAPGSYTLQVDALAASQSLSSTTFASSSTTLSEGTLNIELGTWSGGSPATGFTAKSGTSAVSIAIGAGETSLGTIRDKINAAGAGVTAGIVTDSGGSRLTLRSSSTGQENAFRISVSEANDDGVASTGLSALAYDATVTSSMTRNQTARNAQAVVNGLTVTSASNTLDGVVDGLSIKLNKATSSPVEMSVVADHAALKTAMTDFVTAFNGLNDTIKSETKYDAATKTAGKLQSDRTALDIQSKMRSMLFATFSGGGSGALASLSDIGVSVNAAGSLAINDTKLDAALANPDNVKALLSGGDGSTTAATGFMTRFRDLADRIQGTEGPLQTRTTGLQQQLKRNTDKQDAFELKMQSVEARLQKQYNSLDQKMTGINSMSNSVSLMIKSLYG